MILSEKYTTDLDDFIAIVSRETYVKKWQYKKQGGFYYYNVACSFDIETSSFYNEKFEKQSIMYIWQFCFNGHCIIGRTWKQFLLLLFKLQTALNISLQCRLLIYVHNLAYEFQFMRKYLAWQEFFAVDDRTPIKTCDENGFEFRDSYILSGYSLEKTAEQLHKYNIKKLVGSLDYEKIRTPETPLTHDEILYCIHDVLVVVAYIQEQIEENGDNITKIPLTNTGRVRRYCKQACFNGFENKRDKETKQNYKKLMSALTLDVEEYKLLKRCFMGGFTHAGFYHVGDLMQDVTSYDFTSSYPYVMLSEQFPMGKGFKRVLHSLEEYKELEKTYCMVFDIELIGLSPKIFCDNPLSLSKCWQYENEVVNNGRVVYADRVLTSGTNLDLDIYLAFYNIQHCKIYNCYCYVKDYLPKNFLLSILKLYNDKTTLKGVEEKAVEYLHSKGMLNSCYGMTVTDIAKPDIEYSSNDEYIKHDLNLDEQIHKYNTNHDRFLFYPWGVFVTAYARRNLFSAILECNADYIYSDTDSVKIINAEKHLNYFERYNNLVKLKLQKTATVNNLDFNLFAPKTIKGDEKLIGVWDFDGHYKLFKALRSKCYLYLDDNDKLHSTVAGCGKQALTNYLIKEYKTTDNIFKNFSDGLIIPDDYTGKLTHTYIDNEMKGIVKDYNGVPYNYDELSGVHLSKTSFEISLGKTFINFLMGYKYKYEL